MRLTFHTAAAKSGMRRRARGEVCGLVPVSILVEDDSCVFCCGQRIRPAVIVMPSVKHDSTRSSRLKQIDKARAREWRVSGAVSGVRRKGEDHDQARSPQICCTSFAAKGRRMQKIGDIGRRIRYSSFRIST
jgi:hypothetical protein